MSENVAESGGGIYNAGDLTINSSSTVSNNIAKKYGGGIYNSSVCTLADSTVSGNSAFAGGGVYNIDSSFTINSSDILNNSVSVFGGGIFNIGTLIVSSSSNISGNTAAEEGGGLLNGVNGTATLTSSTVSSNTSQYGGGIYNDGILTLNSTTVSSNTATIYGNNTINGEDVPLSYLPGNSPDDPFFNELWGMKNVNAPTVWNEYTGSDDIIVAVIDTGVDYTHPDLVDNMWHNTGEIPDNGIDDDNNGYIDDYWGWNFVDDDKDPMDDNGHGTHCAGTIGAVGNNGIGVAGVAWDVQIMALKFIDASGTSTTLEAMIDAVHYAVDMGAKILSCSFGGYDFDASEKAAFEYANANGVLAVVAAGNESNDNDVTPSYPASFDLENIIAIAASGSNLSVNNLASFSNYGATTVDFAAPGVGILSTVPYAVTGKYYDYYDGTSMATPMVSGAAALLWSKFPLLNNAQIKDILMESTESVSDLIGKTVTGGRMNLENAYYRGYRWQGSFNDGTDTTTFTSWRTSIDQGFEDLLEGEGVVFFSKSRFVSTEDISENDFLYNTILSDKNDVINILFHNQGIENGKLILPSVENSGLDNEPAIIPVNEKPDTDTAPNGVYEVASNNDKNNIFFKDSVDASSLRFQEPELPFFVQQNDVLEQQSAYIPNSKESNADFYLSDDINSFLDNFMRDEDDYSMFSDCASNFDKPLPFKSELDLILDRLIG